MNIIIPNEGEVKFADAVLRAAFDLKNYSSDTNIKLSFNNLILSLRNENNATHWISQLEINKNIMERGFFIDLEEVNYETNHNLKYIEIIAFVDRVFPSYVTKFVQGGSVLLINY